MSIFAQMSRFDKSSNDMVTVGTLPSGSPWPSGNPLFFAPGNYTINGVTYGMTNEGLYSYFAENVGGTAYGDGERHIVYSSDIDGLMKSMMMSFRFGNRDTGVVRPPSGGVNYAAGMALLKTQIASLLCGDTVYTVSYALNSLGIANRPVHVLRNGTPNGIVDGHQPIEVIIGGRQQCYDVCLNRVWDDPANGGYLSLRDLVVNIGVSNAVAHEPTTPDFDSSPWSGTGYNTCDWWLNNGYSLRQRDAAIDGLYQIPGWDWLGGTINGVYYPVGTYFYLSPANVGRASYVTGLSPNYHVTTDINLINAMFY